MLILGRIFHIFARATTNLQSKGQTDKNNPLVVLIVVKMINFGIAEIPPLIPRG